MNSMKNYNYGVAIDLLHDMPARKIRERVTDIRNQRVNKGYKLLEDAATEEYNFEMDMYANARYRFEPKYTTVRYHILRGCTNLLVLTYQYREVKWEVTKALETGVPVYVFSPYKKQDLIRVTSLAQWLMLCDMEANPSWASWMEELDINISVYLDTPTPWLGFDTLRHYANTFASVDLFRLQMEAELHEAEAEGAWDIDTVGSLVFVEKKDMWRDAKGITHSRYKYADKEFWTGKNELSAKDKYELLLADVCMMYLHMTYVKEVVNYKPLKRMFTMDSLTYTGKEVWLGSALEDMVRATPIYVDLNQSRAKVDYQEHLEEVEDDLKELVYNTLGADYLQEVGYEEALNVIRYNIKHNNK